MYQAYFVFSAAQKQLPNIPSLKPHEFLAAALVISVTDMTRRQVTSLNISSRQKSFGGPLASNARGGRLTELELVLTERHLLFISAVRIL